MKHLKTFEGHNIVDNKEFNLEVGDDIYYRGSKYVVSEIGETSFKAKSVKTGKESLINWSQFKEGGSKVS